MTGIIIIPLYFSSAADVITTYILTAIIHYKGKNN